MVAEVASARLKELGRQLLNRAAARPEGTDGRKHGIV